MTVLLCSYCKVLPTYVVINVYQSSAQKALLCMAFNRDSKNVESKNNFFDFFRKNTCTIEKKVYTEIIQSI